MVSHSISIPIGADIREYIMTPDLHPLVLGLITSMYPDGYTVTETCVNTLEFDEDKLPKCKYIAQAKIDPRKLLWVDRNIDKDLLTHMTKRAPNSVTVDEVNEYRLRIKQLQSKDIKIVSSNDTEIVVTLTTPTLKSMIDNGERWVELVIKSTEELFTDSDNDETKNSKINDILNTVINGIYNIYVSKLSIPSKDTVVTDRSTINDILDTLSGDGKIIEAFLSSVKNYINESNIAIVGKPNYTCPSCKELQKTVSGDSSFKQFIPMNMVEHFFDLGALRKNLIRKRSTY